MKFIDCSAAIGYGGINRQIINHENYIVKEKVNEPKNAEELLAEMDFNGIDGAAVYHSSMIDVSPAYGNATILKECAKAPGRLIPTLAFLPSVYNPDFTVEKISEKMRESGAFALRAYPVEDRFMLDAITCGDVLEYMIANRIPLYLSPAYGWETIFSVMKEFPALTVIITNYGLWGSDGFFYPLVNAYKNVYIDTSDFQETRGIEAFVRKFGSERMLFGTNYPMDNMGGPLAALVGAKIPQKDKENIAHKNIERLMSEVKR